MPEILLRQAEEKKITVAAGFLITLALSAAFFIAPVFPGQANAQNLQGSSRIGGVAASNSAELAEKRGKTIRENGVNCYSGAQEVGEGLASVTENAFCDIRYTDGTSDQLFFSRGQVVNQERGQDGDVTATNTATNPNVQQPDPQGCSLNSFSNIGTCIAQGLATGASLIVGGLAYVVLVIASFILWIVGGLFNWAVIKTVFEFGSTFGTSEGMLIAWGILRDIGNIVLLFSFIFMGLATILNTHALDEYSARKALPRLIIFAVLLNFSLFAAQIVIDTSNSLAAVFTAQAGFDCTEGTDMIGADGRPVGEACANNGIAGRVIQMAGVSEIWVIPSEVGEFMKNPTKHAPVFIGLAIFVTITAVVLLAAAIMFIFRAVMLCLLMVLSPIGFAGMAVPPLQKFAHKWWSQLLSNAFFAPIYLLLVLISLKIVEGLIGPNNNGSFAKAMIEGSTSAPQIFVLFTVVIAFMVASLVMARSMGAAGASFATERAGKLIGGATLGSVGFIGRRTLGSASIAASNAVRRNRYLTEVNPGLGMMLTKVTDKGANSSYSVRGVASKLGKGAGLDFGKPSKDVSHGLHGIEEKAVKERLEYAKSFKGRIEDNKDVATRIAQAEDVREAATAAVALSLDAENAAKLEQQARDAETDKQAAIVRQLRASGATGDKLAAAEKELKKRESALAGADKKLEVATADLAKARAAEAKAAAEAADTTYKRVSAKEQQIRYADSIAHKGLGMNVTRRDGSVEKWFTPTLAVHANHEAAEKIKKNANKSDIEKALDTIKEKTDKKEEKHDDDHKDDGHSGGGGGGGNHGGGGSHGAAKH